MSNWMLIDFSLFVIRLKPCLLYIEFGYIVFAAVPKTLSEIWCITNWHSSTYYNYLEFSIFPATFSVVTFRTEHNGKCKSKSKNIAMLRIVFKNCMNFFSVFFFCPFWLMLMYMNWLFCAQDLYIHLRHGPSCGSMKMLLLQLSLGLHEINAAADLVPKAIWVTEALAQFSCFK